MWLRGTRPRGRTLQPRVTAPSPAGSARDVPPGGRRTMLWCLLRCRRERHGHPGAVSVFPCVRPSQRGHLHGPSAHAAGGDTVTLLYVTLCSFALLEKQVLAAAVKSQQCKNKSGAGDLEICCRCHQITRFKRYLLKRCSCFPP